MKNYIKKFNFVLVFAAVTAAAQGAEFALGVGAYEGRAAFKNLRVADANAKIIYSNDFVSPDAVKDWLPAGRGVWKCGGGTLEQTFGGLGHEAVTLSIPQKFRNVTLTMKAKKIDGKEGFIVATGKNLIKGGGEWVIFGGRANNFHGIEQPPFVHKMVPGSIEQGRWYDVKVECMDDRIRVWLDGSLVMESRTAVDTSGRPASVAPVKDAKTIKYSPMIFGQFIEHHDRQVYGGLFWPGHPLSDEDGFRTDVIKALREIKVPIVRWPGGCFVSAYHWKCGVGPKRQPMWDKAWEVEDPNTFGTDEYVKWCRKVGCEPYICTNAGSGNEEEMSDWVEYCNLNVGKWGRQRIANGYPKPHDVMYGRMDHAARRKNDIASLYNMSDAVFTANFLNACLRHCETVKMACFSPIVNTRGAVFVHDKGIVKRTTYHVFWMYTHLLQPNVVPVSVDCGNLSDGRGVVPVIDAVLTASDDGKRRVLAVVNKSPDKALPFDVSALTARAGRTPLPATVLSGASTDDYNDIGAENRVVPVKATLEVNNGKVSLPPHSLTCLEI